MAKENGKMLHVAMFPWLAFGHMIPFLNVAKLLAQTGHKVSFISTPRNIDRLPKLPTEFASSISFVKIPLAKLENLPENAEATIDIRSGEADYLKKAYDGLEPGLTLLLEESVPDWIIYDFAPYWLPPIATRLGIARGLFFIINAWFLAYCGPVDSVMDRSDDRTKIEDFMVPPKWVNFETKASLTRFEATWVFNASQNTQSGMTDFLRTAKCISGSDAILVRHFNEFEPKWLDLLEELYKRPVIPLGIMPPPVKDTDDGENDEGWIGIKDWLDGHEKGSVVYVALGSEVVMSQDQLTELALGLDLSGAAFFWVLRKVSGVDGVELPSGFEERVKGRGIVLRTWAPQLKILSHDSIGGFLTHCGWSSIVEGLVYGRPLITLPFLIDQGMNSRVIAGHQLGMEVQRDEEDGSYTRESVAKSIKLVVHEDNGGLFREKAKEISKVFSDNELQNRYTNKFIKFLEDHESIKTHVG